MLCNYGCGQKARYFLKLKSGDKWCCSKSYQSCPSNITSWNKGKNNIYSDDTLRKMSKAQKGKSNSMYGKIPWNKGLKLGKQSEELVRKRTKNSKKKRSMISYYKKNHPFLFQVEEIFEDENKDIQTRCKTCNNFFVAERHQISERIRALEKPYGMIENNFYCSEKCKEACGVFRKRSGENTELSYTQQEYETFRQYVLKRDNNQCQYCDKPATDVHHERPQKLEPFFALDPDFAWSCCEKCHYKYGHKTGTECSTGNLANKICRK